MAGANAWQRFKTHHLPPHQQRFHVRLFADLHHHHARTFAGHPAGHPKTQLLASQTMYYTENGNEQMANVVILILIAIVVIGNFIIGRFRGGSLKKGLGM